MKHTKDSESDYMKTTLRAVAVVAMVLTSIMTLSAKDIVKIHFDNTTVKVVNKTKNVIVNHDGCHVDITNPMKDKEVTFVLSGTTPNGSITYHGIYKTTFVLNNLELISEKGCALDLECGKRMKLVIEKGTSNSLTDAPDTIHKACIFTKGHLEMEGKGKLTLIGRGKNVVKTKEYCAILPESGDFLIQTETGNGINSGSHLNIQGGDVTLQISSQDKKALKSDSLMTLSDCTVRVLMTGDGGKGIKSGGDLIVDNATIDISTTGSFVKETNPFEKFGGMPPLGPGQEFSDSLRPPFGGMPPFGPGQEFNDSLRPPFGEMPPFGPINNENAIQVSDSIMELLFAGEPEEERLMMGGRHSYEGTAKAIKAMGRFIMNSGTVKLATQSGGAEGLEGKQGVTVNGGTLWIKSQDDAISSNGKILFNGGMTTAWSVGNDAIDSNCREEGAITIHAGTVYACSQVGPPDEAFDCDFSPMLLTGGTVFGMGGSMGGHATSPVERDDTQPTMVLSNLPLPKGKTIVVTDDDDKEVFVFSIPFSMRGSATIISTPDFLMGKTYHVAIRETATILKTITFTHQVME